MIWHELCANILKIFQFILTIILIRRVSKLESPLYKSCGCPFTLYENKVTIMKENNFILFLYHSTTSSEVFLYKTV